MMGDGDGARDEDGGDDGAAPLLSPTLFALSLTDTHSLSFNNDDLHHHHALTRP